MVAVRLAEAAVFCLIIVKYHVAGRVPKGIIAIRFRDVAFPGFGDRMVAGPGAPLGYGSGCLDGCGSSCLDGCGSDCLDVRLNVRVNEVRKQESSRALAGPAQGRLGSMKGPRSRSVAAETRRDAVDASS